MTATNHALTGAAIGLIVAQPLLAIPIALLSHFVCDALPHYGSTDVDAKFKKGSWFEKYLMIEALFCGLIVLALALSQPLNWWLAAICAFVAASPDLLSMNRYFTQRAGKVYKPGPYAKFATDIQWFERPIGAVVEVAWAVAMIIIIATFVR